MKKYFYKICSVIILFFLLLRVGVQPIFAQVKNFTITASVGPNGQISPTGITSVSAGNDQDYIITADPGYAVADVFVDGESIGAQETYEFSAVNANHTISATFYATRFTITASAGPNGEISPAGVSIIPTNSGIDYTITADDGYAVADVFIDGESIGAQETYEFSSVNANHTISVTFYATRFTITASAGPHGQINPVGVSVIPMSSGVDYTITPDPGYSVADVTVDGVSVGATGTYDFSLVFANHTINANFSPNSYTITAIAGAHGLISPPGAAQVSGGSDQTYIMTPDPGYKVADVIVDGSSMGPLGSFDFPVVTANHTISVTFFPDISLTIKASAGANGSMSPGGSTLVKYGNNISYSITPAAGYHVAVLKVDGLSMNPATSYAFTNVVANHTISATFALTTYTITSSAGTSGTISPAGSVTVSPGGSKTYTIKPSPGYTVADVTLDGVSLGTVTRYVFTNVTASHLIIANFIPVAYIITSGAGADGIISPSGPTAVGYGNNQSYTFTPDAGYDISKLVVDGKSVTIAPSYTFTTVTAAHTITVTFSCPKPAAPVLSGPVTITKQEDNLVYTVTNAVAGITYTWAVPASALIKSGQGTSSIIVTWGKAPGNISCTANSSCNSSSKAVYAVTITTANTLSEVPAESQTIPSIQSATLEVSPNPAQDVVKVRFKIANASKCMIRLVNIAGMVLKVMEIDAVRGTNETSLDVSHFAGGIYFVTLVHGQEAKTLRLVKVH